MKKIKDFNQTKRILLIILAAAFVTILLNVLVYNRAEALYNQALSKKEAEKAVHLEAAVFLVPKSKYLEELAEAYQAMNRDDLAIEKLEDRKEPGLLLVLANSYFRTNQIDKAEMIYTEAFENSRLNEAAEGIARSAFRRGDKVKSKQWAEMITNPDSKECLVSYFELANENPFKLQNNCLILDNYFKNHHPKMNRLYLKLEAARVYFNNQDVVIAKKIANDIIREKPNYRDAYALILQIEKREGRDSKETISIIRAIDPTFSL